MTALERFVEATDQALRHVSPQMRTRAQRSVRWRARALVRLLKMGAMMLAAAVVIPVAMITTGLLLGPRGYEGLVTAPLGVLTAWGAILYWGLRPRVTARRIRRSDVTALPANVEEWLERQRPRLPAEAQAPLESLEERLQALKLQVEGMDGASPSGVRLKRLLVEELPSLVQGYQKLPSALQRKPLHGGPSPTERLVDGLCTVDAELQRVQDRLAQNDLHLLATQQRYLELKYERDRQK